MKRLLRKPESGGYPADYLLARVSGRRARLITDWKPLIGGTLPEAYAPSHLERGLSAEKIPDAVRKWLRREFMWVYCQMDSSLRQIFRPYFFYSELKVLFACLRYIHRGERPDRIDALLADSLLSEGIGAALKSSKDISSVVAALEKLFASVSHDFNGLAGTVAGKGTRDIEAELMKRYLAFIMREELHPSVRAFFMHVIDAGNIMRVYKYLRLDERKTPFFIPGGTLHRKRCRDIAEGRDFLALMSVIVKLTRVSMDRADATHVERAVYAMITRFLDGEGRNPLGIGRILNYLWRCSLQAENLSIIFRGGNLDSKTVEAELSG